MVDRAGRRVQIEGQWYRLEPRGPGSWDVFLDTLHLGWVLFGRSDAGLWRIIDGEDLVPLSGRNDTARVVAQQWLFDHDRDGADPRPA